MSQYAVLVVDMLNDFVTGNFACERVQRIIPPLQKLLAEARDAKVPVIYCNDAHFAGLDHELNHWGEHALAGTEAAEVIPELEPQVQDYVIPKRRFSGFFQTDLHILLRELKVDTLVITGTLTDICVRHTAADAYQWGFDIIVPEDGVEALSAEAHETGISYLKTIYGAKITACAAALFFDGAL